MKRVLLGICGLAAFACVQPRADVGVPAGSGPLIVIYKAAIDDGRGARRGAKIALWAARPDRLHAEFIPPVGGVTFVLDAGGGNVSIVDVAVATAYVGTDGPGAIEAFTGIRVSVADAVAALLDGAAPESVVVRRIGGADGALPESFRIDDGTRSLAIERIRFERGRADERALGTGVPPDGLRRRPLAELGREVTPQPARGGGKP